MLSSPPPRTSPLLGNVSHAPDLGTAALILGAILLLAALLGGALFKSSAAKPVRLILGVAGAALLVYAGLPYLTRSQPAAALVPAPLAAPAAPAAASALPGDPQRAVIVALEDCNAPSAPSVPDAAKATRTEMIAAHTAFQQYDAATNAYTHCVDAASDKVLKEFPQASEAELQTVKVLSVGAHNTVIDQEQALADQFNVQVKAFRAKHPGQ